MQRRIAIAWALFLGALPARADFQISAGDGLGHAYPSVCRQVDGFIAVWESSGADGRDVTLQRLDDGGRPVGAPARANQESAGDQQLPDIACRADGSFLVVWESHGQDGDGLGVYARHFNADAAPAGDELRVNTYTTDHQRRPRVCAGAGGEAVVVWDSFGQDGDGTGIYGRRFAADSTPAGDEFLVNAATAANQSEAAVACAAAGRQLIAWTSERDAGSDVLVRLLHADGALDEQVSAVSSGEDGAAHHASVAAQPSGVFAVALESARAGIDLATVDIPVGGNAAVTQRSLGLEKRNEAPAIAADATGNILVAWSQGSGFDFDVGGLRVTPGFAALRETDLNSNRGGNDGALSTLGRGVAIAPAPNGDLVVWQKRDVFAADSSAAIFAQRFVDCIGDCSGDQVIRVNELIQGVRIALTLAALESCASLDGDGSGTVAINELIRAVREALAGSCPAPVT